MGWFEKIFNTPSHHRVHHASDPKYIDKNHAGSLIIWDKMFGTFAEEIEEPVYGITTPLKSWNPIWANFHYWIDIFKSAAKAEKWSDKIRFLFAPPGWQPDYMGGFQAPKEIDKNTFEKYNVDSTPKQKIYIAINFVIVLGLATWFLFLESQFTLTNKILVAIFIIASLTSGSALFEKKNWFFGLEITRIIFGAYLTFHLSNNIFAAISIGLIFTVLFFGLNQTQKSNTLS
jgi:hypothetical protein